MGKRRCRKIQPIDKSIDEVALSRTDFLASDSNAAAAAEMAGTALSGPT